MFSAMPWLQHGKQGGRAGFRSEATALSQEGSNKGPGQESPQRTEAVLGQPGGARAWEQEPLQDC